VNISWQGRVAPPQPAWEFPVSPTAIEARSKARILLVSGVH